ncbi:chymotrypsin-like protease CTRL-1 [Haliotis asinina]|uniref:chymotrypsin-like protease CTRL-1 n=1 Tax=Haliotis asinina TaxID=109174 RepID=UPI0035322EE6
MRSNALSDSMAALRPCMVVLLLIVGVLGRHPTDASTPEQTQDIQYSNPSQCGTRVFAEHILGRRIVGGSRSVPGEWPWQIYITYDGRSACSGVIIANSWVLTVAHCMQHAESPGRYMVIAGEYNTKTHDGTEQYYSVHKIIIHPEFNKVTGQNDIALMRINSQFALNNNIRPICLPTSANHVTDCAVTGWGETHGHQDSGYLKEARVSIVPLAKCRTDYANVDYTVFDNNLCASGGGNGACEGDSGGPLVCMEQGTWHLRGLVSWGKQCGDGMFPGVYTRVYSYRQWIHNIIT